MKKIEAVIQPRALEMFKAMAGRLGISDFDLVELYRSGGETAEEGKRLYRGQAYYTEMSRRLKLEFVLFDDDVQAVLHQLVELVNPESIAVFPVDETMRQVAGHFDQSPRLAAKPNRAVEQTIREIIGVAPEGGHNDPDFEDDACLRVTNMPQRH